MTHLRVCPACQRRRSGYVAADCDVCEGTGTLELGEPAVHRYGPDIVARAVEVALESVAAFALASPGMTADTAHQALRDGTAKLRRARVLAGRPGDKAGYLGTIARRPVHGSVPQTLDAPPLTWQREDRPVAAGIPGFSAAGYISRLARAADPLDLLGPSTSERADAWATIERKALHLAAVAAEFD